LSTNLGTDMNLRRRRAIRGAYTGFFVDSFDIYLPAIALLPAMMYFNKGLSPGAAQTVTDLTFAATLLGRPIGAFIFGHFSDRLSRKTTGAIAIYGFAAVTLLIACLPGAEQIGAGVAIGLLIFLRFVDGVFLGGEYTAATPMAIEYTDPKRRGLIGGAIQSSATTGYVAIAIFTYLALKIAPISDIDSGYVQWGWRIPFVVGAVLAFLIARFIRHDVEDSEVWQQAQRSDTRTEGALRSKNPVRDTFTGSRGKAFLQVFVVMTGIFFCSNMLSALMPQLLLAHKGFTVGDLTLTLIFCNLLVPFSYVLGGKLADVKGRRFAIITSGISAAVVMTTALALLGSNTYNGWFALTATAFVVAFSSVAAFGIMPAYINERFPTSVRSSGWGMGYSFAVVIPGLFTFYQDALTSWMPRAYTPAVLACFGGILIIIGGVIAPETLGRDLSKVEEHERQPAPGPTAAQTEVEVAR
jgi:MFS family permease